jgi:hypothetical protein
MATIVQDTFTGTNGTNLSSHTPDVNVPGNSWVAVNGNYTISSNQALAGNGVAQEIESIDCANADVTITLDVAIPSGSSNVQGIAMRVTDQNNCWACFHENDGGSNGYLAIAERASGSTFTRASANFSGTTAGTTMTLTATSSGSTITVASTAAGPGTLSYGSATAEQTVTKHGLFGYTASGYTTGLMDNLLVTGTTAAVILPPNLFMQGAA